MYAPEILLILAPILTALSLLCYHRWNDEGWTIVIGAGAVVAAIAFFVTSINITRSERFEKTEVEVVKTTRMVFVDDGEKHYTFSSYEDLKGIDSTTTFYRVYETNFWGYEGFYGNITHKPYE